MYDITQLAGRLKESFGGGVELSENGRSLYAEKEHIVDLLKYLKAEQGFIMLAGLTAVDLGDRFEVVYLLQKEDASLLTVKVRLDRNTAVISSATPVWGAAEVQEREVYDLMGIGFDGHRNLKRILCKDDFEGHPLRKDFKLKPVERF